MRLRLSPFSAASVSCLVFLARAAAADEPPSPPPPTTDSTPPASPPPEAAPAHPRSTERVPATVDASREGVVIERKVASDETDGRLVFVLPLVSTTDRWEPVCVAPCIVELPRWSTYRVGDSNGVTPSGEFTLPPTHESLKLTVDRGNGQVHRFAHVLISIGTAAAITGGALITTAAKFDKETDVRTAGIVTGAVGLVLLAVGIPLAIATRTHVDADGTKVARGRPHVGPQGLVF